MADDTLRGTQTTIPDTLIPDVPMKYNPVDHDPFKPVYETTIQDPLLAKHLAKAPPLFRQLVGDNDKVKIRAVENDPFAQTLDNEAPTVDIAPRAMINQFTYPGKAYKEGINSYDEEINWAANQAMRQVVGKGKL